MTIERVLLPAIMASGVLVAGVLAARPVQAGDEPAAGAEAEPGDVIFADRVRTAFYERAPGALRSEMRRALRAACDAAKQRPPLDDDGKPLNVAVICGNPAPLFYRDVLVTGERLEDGWICVNTFFARFVYVVDDMLEDESCVRVTYDDERRRASVDLTWAPGR